MNKTNLQVALYCRVASSDQLALDYQQEQLLRHAQANDYTVVGIVTENGVSGLSMHRHGINELYAMAASNTIDRVVAVSISRIGRNIGDILHFANTLNKHGVDIETLKDCGLDTMIPLLNTIP